MRQPFGGGAADLPGVRVMSSGLGDARWNSGDVHHPGFDLDAVRAWYLERGELFGLRVPCGMEWRHGGTKVSRQRCMALSPRVFRPAPVPAGVSFRKAGPADVETFARLDAESFGDPLERTREWCTPQLLSLDPRFTLALAELGGEPVGVATCVHTGGSAAVFGVGVVPGARERGIGGALTSRLVRHAFEAGAALVVLNPETPRAGRLYAGLGFLETGGLDIYVNV